jgi:hypothetical protein
LSAFVSSPCVLCFLPISYSLFFSFKNVTTNYEVPCVYFREIGSALLLPVVQKQRSTWEHERGSRLILCPVTVRAVSWIHKQRDPQDTSQARNSISFFTSHTEYITIHQVRLKLRPFESNFRTKTTRPP